MSLLNIFSVKDFFLGFLIGLFLLFVTFFSIRPPPGLLPVLGPLERYMTPTLDTAMLYSSRAGPDLGPASDCFEELCWLYSVAEDHSYDGKYLFK